MGQLLNHKDANSVLAENWMKAENCEVAVKMLPGCTVKKFFTCTVLQ